MEGVREPALQASAVSRETKLAAVAGGEDHADIVLGVAVLTAHRACRNREFGGGVRDRLQTGDGIEGAQRGEAGDRLHD